MTREEWFAQIAHAVSIALDSPVTIETVGEWEKTYPVTKDGVQVGFLVPVKRVGEFQVVTYEDIDFTKYEFRARVENWKKDFHLRPSQAKA